MWNDEFDDNVIDPAKWTYDLGDGTIVGNPGWGNNELEYYTSDRKNVKEEDGKLVITALKEAVGVNRIPPHGSNKGIVQQTVR